MSDLDAVWGWADRFSRYVHDTAALRDLNRQIIDLKSTCGSCARWMTRGCPAERHDDKAGRSRGPSCVDIKCAEHTMKPHYVELLAAKEADAAALRQRIIAAQGADHE